MLIAFEDRLADLLADRLAGVAGVGVVRTLDGASPLTAAVQVEARVASAEPDPSWGDDNPDRIGPPRELRMRAQVHLRGEILVSLRLALPSAGGDFAASRRQLLGALDEVLMQLAAADVRRGQAFDTGADQGFELDGFRLRGMNEPDPRDPALGEFRLRYGFVGRFWPVGEEFTGPAIRRIPTRIAVLPLLLPETLSAREGAELEIPVRIDLRSLESRAAGEAPQPSAAVVRARLRGAAPPGSLIGGTELPAGLGRAYTATEPGLFPIRYRAPDTVAGRAQAHIDLALQREGAAGIPLAEIVVEVTA